MKKTSLDVTIYLVVFSAIQIIVSFGAALSSVFGLKADDPKVLVALSATASIITLIIFLWRKWTPVGKTYIQSKPWGTRDTDSLEAPGADGLYPCAEGAGYAGGIMSAAVDGLRCAEKVLKKYREG